MTHSVWRAAARLQLVLAFAGVAALALLLLYVRGTFTGDTVRPGAVAIASPGAIPPHTVAAEQRLVDDLIDWPASIRSRTLANVAPRVMGRIIDVRAAAGTAVRQGDLLAVLDDRDLRARAEQAHAALRAAEAEAAHAAGDRHRAERLFREQASTQQERDATVARAKATDAQAAQARNALAEAEVLLAESTIRAPFDGVVATRLADPGDMAAPGQPIFTVYDPHALRLEANIGETCGRLLQLGSDVAVHLEAPAQDLTARIDEIAPAADPQTRTLLIKAALPPLPELRPGTYARVRTACGRRVALLIPAAAVTRIGQIESVRVASDGSVRRRNVRTGKTFATEVEIVSGLQPGERVVLE